MKCKQQVKKNNAKNIDVLLSTYNGELFLSEQIESLLAQNYHDWSLIVRDDGSTDKTIEIIKTYVKKYPDKIYFVNDQLGEERLGACQSFARLLCFSSAKYTIFCDQDDICFPNKYLKTLDKIQELEAMYGEQTPLLIHTDLQVVDRQLDMISPSFWKYQNIDPRLGGLISFLLIKNVVTGCALIMNEALRNRVGNIPSEAIMHDWWVVLVAAVFGKVAYLNCPTICYRQHSNNEVGAKRWCINYFLGKLKNIHEIKRNKNRIQVQTKMFLETYKDEITDKKIINLLGAYADLKLHIFFYKKIIAMWRGITFTFLRDYL